MKNWHRSFNIYFALICAVAVAGCSTFTSKKEQSTIRLYLEGQHADQTTAGTVMVTSNKFPYTVERDPFLTEADLSSAAFVNDPANDGGFSLKLRFNDHGSLLLDMYTAANKGKHIVVFSQFPTPGLKAKKQKRKKEDSDDDLMESNQSELPSGVTEGMPPGTPRQSGWLAAVLIRNRLSDGTFTFTPDASRKEGLRIVRGLKNVVAKENKDNKF